MTSAAPSPARTAAPSVVIIGAGFGGLATAVELRRRGVHDIVLLEKGDDVGGVWRDNTYPGAACDVPSSLYSYSFAPNPDWKRRYAQQPDIYAYIRRVAHEQGLLDLVRTGVEVTDVVLDEATGRWRVRSAATTYEADVVVAAVGQLSRPSFPDLPGLDSFAGPSFHSAEWRHDVDLAGKRVAVIGTGASAIQFVPEVQKVAGHLTVFQRSAPYVVPKPDRAYLPLHHRLFRSAPKTQGFGRELTRTLSELLNEGLTEQTRFTDLLEGAFRALLRIQVRDAALRRKLMPDYPIGCKRLLFSNNWYPTLTQPNVEVVDERIAEITPEGVRTDSGVLHPADVLIHGTGFKATEFLAPMRIVGRDGTSLEQEWADGARAYLGVAMPHFPNFFVVYGPNTNLGGSSILSMIECQTGWIGQAVELLRNRRWVEVRTDVAERYDKEMQERLAGSVWAGCASWYRNDSGRITTNWPGMVKEYRQRTAVLNPADLEDPVSTTT